MTYLQRVRFYEAQGMTTSDAQAVCDAEDLRQGPIKTVDDLQSQPIPVTVPDRLLLAAKVALSLIEQDYGADHFAAHLLSDAIIDTERGMK